MSMRQHYIKHGYVDDYSGKQGEKTFVGFHLERWLKRALQYFHVPVFDACCDTEDSVQPVRFNPDTDVIETYNGADWVDAGVGAAEPAVYTVNRALITDNDGAIAVSVTTNTEIGRLAGVTSNVQTQLDSKAELVGAPTSATDTGTAGQIAYDASFFYVCIATDTWKRVAIATW